jgi:type I restriction enzyme, S subunit
MKQAKAESLPEIEMPDAGELPEGWKFVLLGDVCSHPQYGWTTSTDNNPEGLKIIRTSDISSGHIDWSTVPSCVNEPDATEKYLLKSGDILISRAGSVGTSYKIQDCPRSVFASYLIRFRALDSIDTDYLEFFLQSRQYWDAIADETIGITIPNVNASKLKNIPIPLPPLAEQKRIVARVEALLTQVNAARDRLSRVPLIMKKFRQVVLKAACSGRLTEGWREENSSESISSILERIHVNVSHTGREATDNIISGDCILSVGNPETPYPAGWLRVPLTQIARLESGHTPSRKHPDYWDGKVSWIGIEDARINHGGYINKTLQHVTPLGLENSAARLLPPNTVCLSRTASVGYVVVMKSSMATSQDFVNWVCSEALLPKFLMYALMAEGEGIRKFGRGTTHTTIYYPEVKALHICLPPIEEQREIVHRIETLFERADQIEQQVVAATKRTEALTQAVLGKAFAGKL